MADNTEGLVALFIDWDNLAISVAADLGGATPDLKRIVQTAQTFGKVLIARAYAEWNATSERLNVYRAGIEPVYAPTFRFEPDPLTQGARGKSLADPIMVADCIDILHLLPNITTYVIVSGDKDLIPVVRLAQLRGKFVAVIGPDYAAGVLRDICDEFISYRSVIDQENGRLVETGEGIRGGRRPQPSRSAQQPSQAQRGRRQPAMPQVPARGRPREMPPVSEPIETAPAAVVQAVEAGKPEPAIETGIGPSDTSNDLTAVYNNVVDILKQRTGEGKVRLRATNLKDNLMARMPGFSERKFGFPKFKDFLVAAEKAGVVDVTVAGPVHWVSLPTAVEEALEVAPSVPVLAPITEEQVGVEATDLSALADERFGEIVRFIIDLRSRSRWLTYTYVLTNLISFLGRVVPQADAESAARTTLTRLVQEGILRIDREPQEVEVGGIKHRVRMCHLEVNHPFVTDMLAIVEAERQKAAGEETAPSEGLATESAGGQIETEQAVAPEHMAGEPQASEAAGIAEEPVAAAEIAPTPAEEERHEPAAEGGTEVVPAEEATGALETPVEPFAAKEATQEREPAAEAFGQPRAPSEQEGAIGQPEQEPPAVGRGGTLSLEEAYAAVSNVVRQSASSGKPRVRLTGMKAKLTGELGHFDEQIYGFKRFKDFLLAAEKNGWIKLETAGPVVWVTTPTEEKAEEAKGPESGGPGLTQPSPVAAEETPSSETSGVLPSEESVGEARQAEAQEKPKRSRPARRRSKSKQPEAEPQEVLVE